MVQLSGPDAGLVGLARIASWFQLWSSDSFLKVATSLPQGRDYVGLSTTTMVLDLWRDPIIPFLSPNSLESFLHPPPG